VTELVLASFSSGTWYVNELLTTNGAFNNDFAPLLTQVWNFADQSNPRSDNRLNPIIAQTVPVRTYLDPTSDTSAKPGQTLIELPPPSWSNYAQARQQAQLEVPPLPGQDPTIVDDTHHRIRDFMFLDAAVNRNFSGSSVGVASPSAIIFNGITCRIQQTNLGPITAVEDSTQPQVSQGTGLIRTPSKLLVDTTSVVSNGTVIFVQNNVEVTLMLYELVDVSTNKVASVVPNWFGVAIPDGLTDLSKPILYFHPTPGQNNYIDGVPPGANNDDNYLAKTTTSSTGSGRDWRELFAYLDRLGNQLAGALQQGASPNQIVIMPFMTGHSAADGTAGLLKDNWLAVITDILQDVAQTRSSSSSSS
jgi:hypothetical protein